MKNEPFHCGNMSKMKRDSHLPEISDKKAFPLGMIAEMPHSKAKKVRAKQWVFHNTIKKFFLVLLDPTNFRIW
jgi:hypothetical protein